MPRSVLRRCEELGLQPQVVAAEFEVHRDDAQHWSAQHAELGSLQGLPYTHCAPHNLLLAYLAVRGVTDLPLAQVPSAAANIRIPGRMESVDWLQRRWLLDVAHNPAGAKFLLEQLRLRELTPAAVVCGMLADKRHADVFQVFSGAFDVPWFCVDTQGERGMSGKDLAAALAGQSLNGHLHACASWAALIDQVNSATPPGSVILVFGSFNLVEQFHLIDKSATFESPS